MSINLQALTKMPYWLARPASELDKLRQAAVIYWQRVAEMMAWPAKQLDPMTAELELVNLIAWERDITQIPNETELMYRTRVKYALPFAKGAGSKSGWLDMFEKLGMPWITLDERISKADWDVVSLQLLDADLGERQNLIDALCRQYGRTTRRYQYDTIAKQTVASPPKNFDGDGDFTIAKLNTNLLPTNRFMTMDSHAEFTVASVKQEY